MMIVKKTEWNREWLGGVIRRATFDSVVREGFFWRWDLSTETEWHEKVRLIQPIGMTREEGWSRKKRDCNIVKLEDQCEVRSRIRQGPDDTGSVFGFSLSKMKNDKQGKHDLINVVKTSLCKFWWTERLVRQLLQY